MIARALKFFLLAVVTLLLVSVLAVLWLIQTSSGSRWLWNRAAPAIPGELHAESVAGSIGNGFELGGLTYASDGVDVEIGSARLALQLVLFPLTLDVRLLAAEGVIVQQKESDPPADTGEPVLETLRLPLAIVLRDVSVSDLEVRNTETMPMFALERAAFAGRWHEEIEVSRLQLESDVVSVEQGSVYLSLRPPHATRASLGGVYPVRIGDDPVQPVRVGVEANGSLADLQIEVATEGPAVQVAGNLFDLTGSPGWDLRVRAPHFQWPLAGTPEEPPQVRLRDGDFTTAGSLAEWSARGTGFVTVAGKEELSFELDSSGNEDGMELTGLAVHGDLLEASALARLDWSQGFAIAAAADVERFDAARLTQHWPAGQPVSGRVGAAWDAGNVQLNEVRLRVAGSETTLDATGEIDLEENVVDLDLDWKNVQWPMSEQLDEDVTRFISESGEVAVSGSLDAWQFDGRIAFRTDSLPDGVFMLAGNGNREQVEATLSESEVLGGRASGNGSYNWKDGGRWSAELVTENVETGPLLPEFPGRISSTFQTRGTVEPLRFTLDIGHLEGTLRNMPLEGQGGVDFADGNLTARNLRLSSGDAELVADGNPKSDAGLEFAIDAAAIEALYPDVAGSLQAAGNVSFAGELPSLQIDLLARDLYWRDYALEQLVIEDVDTGADTPLSLEVTGTGLSAGTREIERVMLRLAAGQERQRLELHVSPEGEQRLEVELDGRLDDWRRPLDSAWVGQLASAEFEGAEGTSFALDGPAALRLATNLATLDRSCFVGDEEGSVCLAAGWTKGRSFGLTADMQAIPLNLVGAFYQTNLEFTQELAGSVEISGDAEGAISGQGDVDISPGSIRDRTDDRVATQTGAGELHFDLERGQLLAGRLILPFSDSAEVDASFEAADVSMGKESPVEGQLAVHFNDIAALTSIVPVVEDAHGRLDVDLKLGGTLGDPLFSGETSLANGQFYLAPLGLRLEDIQMKTVVREDNRIDLQSTFRAGEGSGELQSSARSLAGLRDGLELYLRGDNLTVIDLPDINVVADADLAVGIQQDTLSISGNVLIPRARLAPVNLTSDKVTESDDVVIVANGNGETAEPEEEAPFNIDGTVALVLGDDVVVDLDVAEARIKGTTAFRWEGPPMPVANGQYNVEGRFEAYGQLLDITEGAIRFPGVPAAQPNLRIRAEREIFGNPQIRSAGVLVTGSPPEPQVEVYTNPPTTRDRAVTLLVTGSDFNYEQGVGAVDVGTYIAPKLFVSYGIGLFERGNVISLRYDIAKGFGIKATSGKNTEGVDLSYTLER